MILHIDSLNNKLINFLEEENIPLGLANGKMGFCIYFYCLTSIYKNRNYEKIAEKLLNKIFDNINTMQAIDVKDGLAGIGLAIDYLVKNNFVKGDINSILSDVDDTIFKNTSYSKYLENIDTYSLIHILYYLCVRLKDQKRGSDNEYLFKELIIQIINNLYEYIDMSFCEEPYTYNTDYSLPQLLIILSDIYRLDFYNYRLIKIIEKLSYKVLSTFPILHTNRLYLLSAMDCLNKQIRNESWQRHIHILRENIDLNHILNHELRNRNIYFNNGLASICLFINKSMPYFDNKELKLFINQAIYKIKNSQVWTLLGDNSLYFESHAGLYNGFTGVFLSLQYLKLLNL